METMMAVFSLVFGCVIGSFLNVVILRLPAGESIVYPASRCPRCHAPIHWHDNIPVLSFLVLRARCRACRAPISWRYPLVELCMGLLSMALWKTLGPTPALPFLFVFCAMLLAVAFIDLDRGIIPDAITLPGIMLGFAASVVSPLTDLQSSGLGIILGGGVLYLIAEIYFQLTGRDGMGGGDIKLLAMIGAWLGWQALLPVLFMASCAGSVIGIGAMVRQGKGGRTVIPFGPFLAVAALVYLFQYRAIILVWLRLAAGDGASG